MPATADEATTRLLRTALERFSAATRFPVVFGGLAHEDAVVVSALRGNRGDALRGLEVQAGRGLGGRALVEGRPRITPDYGSAKTITHDYDRAVLGEGISTLMAMPVIVDGEVRGLLWGGVHADIGIGDVQVGRAAGAADWLAEQLAIRTPGTGGGAPGAGTVVAPGAAATAPVTTIASRPLEALRETYAELRSIGSAVDDPALRARIEAVERRLAALASGQPEEHVEHSLSPRELDVLGHVAVGRANADIAARLGLRESTVKSYLVTAMGKLAASTRHEAVSAARRIGALP